jgi:hypothetical protein
MENALIDLPPNLPDPVPVPPHVMEYCVNYAAAAYEIHPMVIQSVIDVEGGKVGTVSKNSNGTYDLGVMQINTVNIDEIQGVFPTVTLGSLIYSPCTNISVGTWMLVKRINEAGDLWKGVGNYHSKTPKYHNRYMAKINKAYRRLFDKFNQGQH